MPPILPTKTFNIPFSGGAATVVCLVKFTIQGDVGKTGLITQYNSDGTTADYIHGDLNLSISVSNGVMTVTLIAVSGYIIEDSRCCLIPGDPFA